jgi:hypothetical protein
MRGGEGGDGHKQDLTPKSAQGVSRAPEAAQIIADKIGISRDKVRQARKVHERSPGTGPARSVPGFIGHELFPPD